MKIEVLPSNTTHFGESVFGNTPEVFDAVYMCSAICENVLTMGYSVVFFVVGIYKPVVGFPFVAVNG